MVASGVCDGPSAVVDWHSAVRRPLHRVKFLLRRGGTAFLCLLLPFIPDGPGDKLSVWVVATPPPPPRTPPTPQQVAKIAENTRPDRQTIMISATFPKAVEAAAKQWLKDPIEIVIGGRSSASSDVTQYVELFDNDDVWQWSGCTSGCGGPGASRHAFVVVWGVHPTRGSTREGFAAKAE